MTAEWVEPEVTEAINRLTYYWANYEMLIEADRITDAGQAELWCYHSNSTGNRLFRIAKVNLLSPSTMSQLEKKLGQHSEALPWLEVLTYITKTTMEYQRRGEPPALLQPGAAKALQPAYYIDPLVIKGVPNIIFGEKGVNKTTLALTLLGLIEEGFDESPCGLVPDHRAKTAMLDWEANKDLTDYTLARLIEGKTIRYFELPYLRCSQTLADDISRIGNFLHDNRIEVVLIDSLGQAAGSDKFDSSGKATALKFFECLRQLNITSLIIGQTAKDDRDKRSIFGSTYFTYYSRNIFMLQAKEDELDNSRAHLALFHREANYSKRAPPMGFCATYTDTTINLTSEAVSLSQFLEKAGQNKAVLDTLLRGAKTRQSIGKELHIPARQIGVILNRLANKGQVASIGSGLWQRTSDRDEATEDSEGG